MSTVYLPPELWLEVFHWATSCPDAYTTSYKPFTDSHTTSPHTAVSCNFSLVCRSWRNLCCEFLFRNVHIGHGQSALKGALNDERSFSRFVRRAVLPFQYTSTPTWSSAPLPSVEILKLCNQLEVLIRPLSPSLSGTSQQFQFDADSLPLPSLKRLEWSVHVEAEASGGINSLQATLQNTPNLLYLAIGNVSRSSMMMDFRRVSLPFLETLIVSLSGYSMHQIAHSWLLPSLKHLSLTAVYVPDVSPLWETYGEQLESLELGRHASFFVRDVITSALNDCPHLEELNFYPFFTVPPVLHEPIHTVHTVGLHAAQNLMFFPEAEWVLIEKHFAILIGSLSALRTVRLFGDWSRFLEDAQFAPIHDALCKRGCNLVVT